MKLFTFIEVFMIFVGGGNFVYIRKIVGNKSV